VNENKLNKFALKIAKDIMKARPSVPLATAIGVSNYKMANICSQLRIYLDTESGYEPTPANIYQLLLLNSGGGKGASLGLADNFYFKDAFKYIGDVVYPMFKSKALERLETEGNERSLHNWVKTIGNATESGLLAYAETYSLTSFGGINIEVDEIGNAVISKADVFELLLQPYDNGLYVPNAKRTDPNAISVSGQSTNLYCFGNKVRLFEGDKVEQSFLKLLDEGYGRRMIFIDDNSTPTRRTAEQVMQEMEESDKICKSREEDREYIQSLVTKSNMNRVFTLTKEAKYMWAMIKAEGDNYVLDNKHLEPAVKSDMAERNFKVAKLACIYAFFDGNEQVTKKNMEEALEVIENSSKALRELRKIKPTHERLLEAMIAEEKACTSQHLLSYPFINSTWTKKIQEVIDLAKELASERGYVWNEKIAKGVVYYRVKKKSKKDEDEFEEINKKEKEEVEKLSEEKRKLLEELYS
jgi:hypothetical protein